MKLLLVDTEVDSVELVAAIQSDVECIYFNQFETTFADLSAAIIEKGISYEDIAIVQHTSKYPFIITLWKEVDASGMAFDKLVGFIGELKERVGLERLDILACSIYSNGEIRKLIANLETQTGIDLRASTNLTGNPSGGGDWILESDNVDIRNKYFTEAIENFQILLGPFDAGYYFGSTSNNYDVNGREVSEYDGSASYNNQLNNGEFPPCNLYYSKLDTTLGRTFTSTLLSKTANRIDIAKQSINRELVLYKLFNNRINSANAGTFQKINAMISNCKKYLTTSLNGIFGIAILTTDNILYYFLENNGNLNIDNVITQTNVRDIFSSGAGILYITSLINGFIIRYENNTKVDIPIMLSINGNPAYIQGSSPYIRSIVPLKKATTNYEFLALLSNGQVLKSSTNIESINATSALVLDGQTGRIDYIQFSFVTYNVYLKCYVNPTTNINRIYACGDGWILVKNNGVRIGVGITTSSHKYSNFAKGHYSNLNTTTDQQQFIQYTNPLPQTLTQNQIITTSDEGHFSGFTRHLIGNVGASVIFHNNNMFSDATRGQNQDPPLINIEVKGNPIYGGDTEWSDTNGKFATTNPASVFGTSPNQYTKMPRLSSPDNNIKSVVCTYGAFAALTTTGKVFCWGHVNYGGVISAGGSNRYTHNINGGLLWPDAGQPTITKIYANHRYFFAINSNGNVLCWGGSIGHFKTPAFIYQNGLTNKAVEAIPSQFAVAIILENGSTIYRYIYPENTFANTTEFTANTFFNNSSTAFTYGKIEAAAGITLTNYFPLYAVPSEFTSLYHLQLYQFPSFKQGTLIRRLAGGADYHVAIETLQVGDTLKTSRGNNVTIKQIIKYTAKLSSNASTDFGNEMYQLSSNAFPLDRKEIHKSALIQRRKNVYMRPESMNFSALNMQSLNGNTSELNNYYQLILNGNVYKDDLDVGIGWTGQSSYGTLQMKSYCNLSDYITDSKLGANERRLNVKYSNYIKTT